MADLSILRQAPLDYRSLPARAKADLEGAGLGLGEVRFRGELNLRVRRDDSAARQSLETALGATLPETGKSASVGADQTLLALGPDEWLLVGGDDRASAKRLRQACEGQFVGITEVGENYCTFVVTGPAARRVLARGCPLDLHPRSFRAGDVAGTLVAKATVVLHLVKEDGARGALFHVLVRRSFSDYLFRWLEDAGREEGVTIVQTS